MEKGHDIDSGRQIGELSLDELLSVMRKIISDEVNKCLKTNELPPDISGLENSFADNVAKHPRKYAFGLSGLAKFLHCSERTAYTYMKSGKYDAAIRKLGRRYVIDKALFESIHFKSSEA